MGNIAVLQKGAVGKKYNIHFSLVCLAFAVGVLIFRLSRFNAFYIVENAVPHGGCGALLLGCIFLLLLTCASAVSCLGLAVVPLLTCLCGYTISAFAGFIIPVISDDTPLIAVCILTASAYTFIFAFIFVSLRAMESSGALIKRTISDSRFKAQLVQNVSVILAVALIISPLFFFLSKYIFGCYF